MLSCNVCNIKGTLPVSLEDSSKICLWSGLHPRLDVGHIAHSLLEGGQLGELLQGGWLQVADVHEDVSVGPGQRVADEVFSSSADESLLQLAEGRDESHLREVLEGRLVLGEVELDEGVGQVLDHINDLVHLSLLQ